MFDTASNSPRSTPTSSPAVRKRLPLPARSLEGDLGMVEKGSDSSSEKGLGQSLQGTLLSYPAAGRNLTRSAKKVQSWYSVLSPTYKQRNEDFRKTFRKLPDSERLIVDYSCALQREILLQGRLYVSENWLCFYSNIFRWETTITIQLKDVMGITKEKTAKLIPNAIQICTDTEKHFFTSFGARDRSFMLIFRLWQNALMEKSLSPKELWHIVHQCYGTELGLTSEDEDYVSPKDEINGIGNGEDSISDTLDLIDPTSRSSVELRFELSPQADRRPPERSLNSVDSSEGIPSVLEDLDVQDESLANTLSNQTLTSLPDMPKADVLGNHSSLDLINGDDIPTDISDSSTTPDEGEVEAFCSDLSGRLLINAVFRCGVDKLYQMLFTNSQFMQDFLDQRKFTEITMNIWNRDDQGNQSRVISYTVAINNPLGPKSAPAVETQTLYKSSQKSECYVVDTEVVTQGIPYQDYFYIVHRYCLTHVTKNKCRLRVSSDIRFRKQPWNMVKVLIEKNTWSGIQEYFQHLQSELSRVEKLDAAEVGGKDKSTLISTLRRRKRPLTRKAHYGEGLTPITSLSEDEKYSRLTHTTGLPHPAHSTGRSPEQTLSTILLIISFSVLVLVVLNMVLLYRMWCLERTARTLETWHAYTFSEGKYPQTAAEWAEILELQKRFHGAEVRKWKQALKSSVGMLEEMKFSLEKLHKGIVVEDPPLESEGNKEEPVSS
ncbi:protein Aster-A isoform X1 [Latimeria chalumnae]|uniref:protein Aster-A isoform X1 n=2 Tax=Latimeria chalumnae TaxID=7897 RepID=UPI00313C9645